MPLRFDAFGFAEALHAAGFHDGGFIHGGRASGKTAAADAAGAAGVVREPLFSSRAYAELSSRPEVAVAARQLRELRRGLAEHRGHGAPGEEWLGAEIGKAEAKLRRRMKRVLRADIAELERARGR